MHKSRRVYVGGSIERNSIKFFPAKIFRKKGQQQQIFFFLFFYAHAQRRPNLIWCQSLLVEWTSTQCKWSYEWLQDLQFCTPLLPDKSLLSRAELNKSTTSIMYFLIFYKLGCFRTSNQFISEPVLQNASTVVSYTRTPSSLRVHSSKAIFGVLQRDLDC